MTIAAELIFLHSCGRIATLSFSFYNIIYDLPTGSVSFLRIIYVHSRTIIKLNYSIINQLTAIYFFFRKKEKSVTSNFNNFSLISSVIHAF